MVFGVLFCSASVWCGYFSQLIHYSVINLFFMHIIDSCLKFWFQYLKEMAFLLLLDTVSSRGDG